MATPTVFIVDDDAAYLDSISVLIGSMGLATKTYASPADFLAQFNPQLPGCLILDVRMPIMGGLSLQEELNKLPLCPPIIIMTGHAEVPTALRAMRQGAIDFIQKTFTETELYDALQRAIARDVTNREKYARSLELNERFSQLTTAERDVLDLVVQGVLNKNIATTLQISQRAVEDRRARIMQKLSANSIADLIRQCIEGGLTSESTASRVPSDKDPG